VTPPAAPPRLARWILQHALTGPTRSAIVGDIEEEFAEYVAPRLDRRSARRWFWRQTLLSIAACVRGPDVPESRQTFVEEPRMPIGRTLEDLRDDTVGALRQMRRAPGFTALAAATLALGIGANSAIFALVDATLLRPLPVHEPDRLVLLSERNSAGAASRLSPPNLLDLRDRARSVESLAGFVPRVGAMVLAGPTPESVPRQWVTTGFFDVFGVRPIAGRTFSDADNAEGAPETAVISEGFWRSRFGGDPAVVGRIVRLDGDPYTIIGVVPQHFQITGRTSLWAVLKISRAPDARGAHVLQAIGRLRPGVTLEAARADVEAVAAGLAREFPATNAGRRPVVDPLHDALIGGELRLTSMLFLGVVGFVLLICCANVANLLMARAAVRTRELAIRTALGAERGRVARQLMTESLVLAALGGLLGLGVGMAIAATAPALIPPGLLPPAVTVTFDLRVAAFCAAATLAVGLLFGIAPAWQASRFEPTAVLATDSRSVAGGGGRMRRLLVAAEVATAVALLAGAGLLLRTLLAVETFDRGFRVPQTQVLTLYVDPIGSRYPTRESLLQFYEEVRRETAAVPGVATVAWTSQLPLTAEEGRDVTFEVVGDPAGDDRQRPAADNHTVSPEYFDALDLPIVAGRGFTDRDTAASPPVCLVNEALARGHLRGRPPLGARLALRPAAAPRAEPTVCEVVGIVRQVRGRPDEREAFVQVYRPLAQRTTDDIHLVVRAAGRDASTLTAAVRAAIARVDRDQLVGVRDVRTLEDVAWTATERHRFRAVLVVTFAGLAVALAMVGVFGIVGYAVQQRVRDFAVRRALGASAGDVLRLVVASIAPVFGAGLAIGLALAAALGRTIGAVLVDVDPVDPYTFAATGGVLLLVGVLAVAGPALRALRVDPAQVLRGG
jgi:putative ABC transport system permease protein